MAKIIALYKHPKSAEAFDRYYRDTHIPLAKKIPGLRRYDISTGGVGGLGGDTPYHLVATLAFDSRADIEKALSSPEGQVVAKDLDNFADGGVELLIFDTEDV
ncbi:MAG: EthD family reductase [Pararhizobium sp.]